MRASNETKKKQKRTNGALLCLIFHDTNMSYEHILHIQLLIHAFGPLTTHFISSLFCCFVHFVIFFCRLWISILLRFTGYDTWGQPFIIAACSALSLVKFNVIGDPKQTKSVAHWCQNANENLKWPTVRNREHNCQRATEKNEKSRKKIVENISLLFIDMITLLLWPNKRIEKKWRIKWNEFRLKQKTIQVCPSTDFYFNFTFDLCLFACFLLSPFFHRFSFVVWTSFQSILCPVGWKVHSIFI